jgi:hypothetical protein
MAAASAAQPMTLIIDGSALISGLFMPAGGTGVSQGLDAALASSLSPAPTTTESITVLPTRLFPLTPVRLLPHVGQMSH